MNQSVLFHPIPYSNESLANYIIRIKDINCLELKWIYERLDLPKSKYLHQFNLIQKEGTLIGLSNFTCLEVERIKSMTLNKYFHLSTFKESNDDEYFCYYVISNGTSKYCPMCLTEKQYHRLYWQLRKIRVCLKHKINLIESCSKCGEILDVKSIIEGKCDCGHLLTDVNVEACTNDSIINYQKHIYELYDVNLNSEIIERSQDHCKATSEILINFIEDLVKIDKEVTLELDSPENRENHNCFPNMEYIEKIRTNLPRELTILLDSLNYKLDCLKVQKGGILSNKYMLLCHTNKVYSPLFCLRLVAMCNKLVKRLECAKYIDDLLIKYFYSRYNANFIINRMKKDIDNINGKISILEYNNRIMNIFEIDDKTMKSIVKQEYNMKNVNNCDYLYYTVNKIVDIFLSMIKWAESVDSEILHDNECISLYELYSIFRELCISFLDIVNIIINDKINIIIDPFYIGTNMIYVPREIMKNKLLCLAVKRIQLDI